MIKKISLIVIGFLSIINLSSCDKESPGFNYEFSNTLPPYVALKSKAAVSATKGSTVTFTIQSRTSLQQNTIVKYSVSGVVTLANQSATLLKDKTSVDVSFTVPANAASGTATVSIISAAKADGTPLTIGSNNVAAEQKFTVNVN